MRPEVREKFRFLVRAAISAGMTPMRAVESAYSWLLQPGRRKVDGQSGDPFDSKSNAAHGA